MSIREGKTVVIYTMRSATPISSVKTAATIVFKDHSRSKIPAKNSTRADCRRRGREDRMSSTFHFWRLSIRVWRSINASLGLSAASLRNSRSHCLQRMPMIAHERLSARLENQNTLMRMASDVTENSVLGISKEMVLLLFWNCCMICSKIKFVSWFGDCWSQVYDSIKNAVTAAEKRPAYELVIVLCNPEIFQNIQTLKECQYLRAIPCTYPHHTRRAFSLHSPNDLLLSQKLHSDNFDQRLSTVLRPTRKPRSAPTTFTNEWN